MPSTGLLDLPNEILEDIIERSALALPKLFGLAESCQRLKEICLSLYLKNSGNPHPEDACKITVPPARRANFDLKVLSLASWITKTKRLECDFSNQRRRSDNAEGSDERTAAWLPAVPRSKPESKPRRNFKTLLFQLSKIEALVTRFASVDEVALNFNPLEVAFRRFSEGEAIAWSETMGRLLNIIVERGCTDLQVRGLHQVYDVYTVVSSVPLIFVRYPPNVSRNPPSVVDPNAAQRPSDILSGPTWTYKWNGRTGSRFEELKPRILTTLSTSSRLSCQLTNFTIGSVSLLLPPVLQWTCSILSCPSIVSLTLCGIPELEINWLVLGTHFAQACPKLKRLTFSTDSASLTSWSTMKSFMCVFQQLEYISADDLDSPSWISILDDLEPDRGTAKGLHLSRSIRELRLSENWVQYLDLNLQDFPDLEKFSVTLPQNRQKYGLSVPHRTIGVTELHFTLNLGAVSGEDIVRMPLAHIVQAFDDSFWPTDSVTGVELVFTNYTCFANHDLWGQQVMKRWFAKFPKLKEVAVTSGVGNQELEQQMATIEHFCRCIMVDVLRQLERFEVNGQVWGARKIRSVMETEKSATLS